MVGTVDIPEVGRVETFQLSSLPRSGQLSPESPRTIAFEDLGDSSVPLSPNRVQAGRSQEVPEDGSLFNVSPVSPGFLMCPSVPLCSNQRLGCRCRWPWNSFSDPVLGDPIAFAQCALIPGSDTPLTLPVYTMPSGLAYAGTVFCPDSVGVGSVYSTEGVVLRYGPDIEIADIAREGPFDTFASPMYTEDIPLVTTGLPGCPYRITSYNGPAISDINPAFGFQLHHPRFLEFIGAPESARLLYHSLTFWMDRLGEEHHMAAAVNLQRDAGIMLLAVC